MFCIRPEFANKLLEAFKKDEINPDKLNELDSKSRREFLSKHIGEDNAKEVNLLFEKKLLLKNQERAMYDFAKDVTGLSDEARQRLKDRIKQNYEERSRRVFDPKEDEGFLNEITSDVYSKRFKTDVSLDEAQQITELYKDMRDAYAKKNEDNTWKSDDDKIRAGAARVALNNYIGELKRGVVNENDVITNPLEEEGVLRKIGSVFKAGRISIGFIGDNARSILASVDNSLWFRQGLKALVNPLHTKAWADNFIESWKDIGKTIGAKNSTEAGDAILDSVKVDAFTRENYLNGRYEMGKKLDIATGEEAYPTSLPEKIPLIGRLFKASEVAYNAGAMRLRMDIADKLYDMAEQAGVDLTDPKQVGDINEVVNSMTGRGRLSVDPKTAKTINSAFFSIKFVKSNIDTLTLHQGKLSEFATQQAAYNLLAVVAVTGTVLGIAKALDPDSTDFDPKSNLFGKIRIGKNVPIDITAGMAAFVTLAAKIATQEKKNSKTGITTKLGEGYGTPTAFDELINFTAFKASPLVGIVRDYLKHRTPQGENPTLLNESKNLVTPIPVSTWLQSKDESAAIRLATTILDGVGFNANPGTIDKDWGQNTGKVLAQFREKVGDEKFKKANETFNKKYNDWIDTVTKDAEYKKLSDEDKKHILTKGKSVIKEEIFDEYDFTYERKEK